RNYIWLRTATLDFYASERTSVGWEAPLEVEEADARLRNLVPPDARLERVAGGFEFTEGPVWTRDGAVLFSSPNTNAIYRWRENAVTGFGAQSVCAAVDVGGYPQTGSNGLRLDPEGRLVICQHGTRRVLRVN